MNPYLSILMKDSIGFGADGDDEEVSEDNEAVDELRNILNPVTAAKIATNTESEEEEDTEDEESEEEIPGLDGDDMAEKAYEAAKKKKKKKKRKAYTNKQLKYLRKINNLNRKIKKARKKLKAGKKRAFGYGNLKKYISKKKKQIKALRKKGGLNQVTLPSAFNPFKLATTEQLATLSEKEQKSYHMKRSATLGLGVGAAASYLATMYFQSQETVALDEYGMAIDTHGSHDEFDIQSFSRPPLKDAFENNKTAVVGTGAVAALLLGYITHSKTTKK